MGKGALTPVTKIPRTFPVSSNTLILSQLFRSLLTPTVHYADTPVGGAPVTGNWQCMLGHNRSRDL